ncbi:ribonuclease H-like domain-containing protein [Microdochium trichocladiopsis]|uniref:Ribonuclease H-like domain-containing protein n=1 Tax=Microdochium trichocladiopsis TaxID=1682393 RepID=A0A9P9BRJ9_9PEZI|nr:ribonuclease H-like domain-containing protein [Microdochium trichocladiopsis]KAH7032996.1 ribonuclease H-like domain-containing protein [Microdochium trichocladiopsis]
MAGPRHGDRGTPPPLDPKLGLRASPSPKQQLWHFSRGISFAATASAPSTLPAASPVSQVAAATPMRQSVVLSTASTLQVQPVTTDEAPTVDEVSKQPGPSDAKDESRSRPPQPLLDFRISEDAFYAAKKAMKGTPESFWSYNMYRGPPNESGEEQKVKIHYCRSKHTMERVCQDYFMDEEVIGFDLEWAPEAMKFQGPRKNVSLIQLASPSRVALFHTAIFSDKDIASLGPNFRHIMESPDILKTGVAIKGDATRLRNFFGIDSRGLMELSHLYKLVTFSPRGEYKSINRRLVPLALQVEEILHLPLYKGQDVRGSDWSKPLSMEQIIYAASDAYAGPHLFATLEHMRVELDPCPPRPHPAESNLPIRIAKDVELPTSDELQDDDVKDNAVCKDTTVSAEYVSSVLESITIEEEQVFVEVQTKTPGNTKPKKTAPVRRTRPRDSKDGWLV